MDRRRRIAPTVAPPPPPRKAPRSAAVPAPRPVRHLRTLWWWAAALLAALAVHRVQDSHADRVEPSAIEHSGSEREAFLAFAIDRVGDGHPDAVPVATLHAQLVQLQESGAQFVSVEQVQEFYQSGAALPGKPVLLVLSEARRETVEALDPILAELELRAVAFVNVEAVEQGNLELVSRRRLGQMFASGRWQPGLNACATAPERAAGAFPTAEYQRRIRVLESWSELPVAAISCLRGWDDDDNTRTAWAQTLTALSLPVGFVGQPPAVNRADDPPAALRLVPVGNSDGEPDALVRRRLAYTPRHQGVVDDFSDGKIASAWVASNRHARIHDGYLQLVAGPGDYNGVLALGGTERWRDAEVTVDLARRPQGQFWIYARRGSPTRFVRLGIAGDEVVLQCTDADGQTRQVAAAPLPPGAMSLTLRVVGSRAIALLDGQPLLDRPAELSGELAQGPVALVSWNADAAAQTTLRKVAVEPLPRRIALLDPAPSDAEFARLLDEADRFWAVSPKVFRWNGKRGYATDETAASVAIFAGHQRIALLPTVTAEHLPSGKAWDTFSEQLLEWAQRPQYAGLNLMLDRLRPEEVGRIGELRKALAAHDRELTVTVGRGAPELAAAPDFVLFTESRSGAAALPVASARARQGPG